MATYKGRFQLLAKPATEWNSTNPVLLLGEYGVADPGSAAPFMKCGDGVRPWSALPNLLAPVQVANDYVAGTTTTLPPGGAATVVIDNTVDPPTISFAIPQGPVGPVGPPNSLTIGTVTTGAPGSSAAATITGTPPNQVLSLTIPQGPVGPVGPVGPPNSLAIGTVTTGAPGAPADATITGTPPNQTLNLSLPQGQQGPQGIQGVVGPAGPPNTLAIGTVTASAPGGPANATITGTAPNQTLNLTIPRGDPGPQGPQGPAGNAGTVLADDSRVTGDWRFNPTMFFNYSDAEVTAVKADPNLYANDASEAVHVNGRMRFERADVDPFFRAHRLNGGIAGPWTPILAGQSMLRFESGGSVSPGLLSSQTGFQVLALENFTSGAQGTEFRINAIAPGTIAPVTAASFRGDRVDIPLLARFTNNATSAGALQIVSPSFAGMSWNDVSSAADNRLWYAQAVGAHFRMGALADALNASADFLNVTRTGNAISNITFGNATNNPGYTFLGNGLALFGGAVQTTSEFVSSGGSVRAINGPGGYAYLAAQISGTEGLYFAANDTNGAVAGGIPAKSVGIGVAAGSPFVLVMAGAERLRIISSGTATFTTADATIGLQIAGASGYLRMYGYSGGYSYIQALNTAGNAYIPLSINAHFIDVQGAGTSAQIKLAGKCALYTQGGDTWLRLNEPQDFSSGVYTPGLLRADAGLLSDTGLANSNASRRLVPNSGGMTYGTVYVQGAHNTYHGYGIKDDYMNPVFIANGSGTAGIYLLGDAGGKWLIYRSGAGQANCQYSLDIGGACTASLFQVTSARALKRETGRPTRAADVLERLRPVLYRLLADESREQLGLIAEEVQEVCPLLSDGKAVMYDRLALLLLADWQEQRAAA